MFGLPIKWARRVMVLSLVLNFLVIGAVIGVASKPMERRIGSTTFMTQTILDLTDDQARATLRERLVARRDGRAERRKASRETWTQIVMHLRTVPFDAAMTAAVFDEMRSLRDASRADTYGVINDAIAAMSDAERSELAARMDAFIEQRSKQR